MDDFFILRMGKTPPRDNSDYWLKGTNNWVAISDMGKSKYISTTSECITDKSVVDCNMVPVPANTVIMSFKLSIGKTAITRKPIFTNEAIMSFLPKTEFADNILVDYVYYYLLGHRWVGTGKKAVMGVTLNKASLSATQFSFPPLADQKQAIAELDKINEVIADCRELLRNLDALAHSLFYDYFGDPITNPKGWDRKPLMNAVIEMFLGPFGSALKTDCYVSKDNAFAMVYEQKHAIKKTLEQENHFINKEKFMSLKRFEVIPLDFIMSCRGTIGQLYQIPENSPRGIIHPSLMKIRLNSTTYNPAFFKFLLPIIIKEQQTKGNCVQMAITAKELGSKKLPVPPLALQEKFAARIEQIEEQKKSVEQTIAELQTLLDSRMDYWFN